MTVSLVGFESYEAVINTVKDTVLIIELKEGIELDEVVVEHKRSVLRSKGLGHLQMNLGAGFTYYISSRLLLVFLILFIHFWNETSNFQKFHKS